MIVRKDYLRASKAMQSKVSNTPNIEVLFNSETVEILGKEGVEGVLIRNNKTSEEKQINIEGFFCAVGHTPNTRIFKGQLEMDEAGYLITKPNSTQTNVAGVFAAGDVKDYKYRQAITAAGSGCMAGIEAERYLSSL